MANVEIIHAYRHLYRHGLRAVHFSKPARYVLRDKLRAGFRETDAEFNPRTIGRTVQFLQAATQSSGIEHKVLKNILFVSFHRQKDENHTSQHARRQMSRRVPGTVRHTEATAFKHYDMTIAMLNKSMELCLR